MYEGKRESAPFLGEEAKNRFPENFRKELKVHILSFRIGGSGFPLHVNFFWGKQFSNSSTSCHNNSAASGLASTLSTLDIIQPHYPAKTNVTERSLIAPSSAGDH